MINHRAQICSSPDDQAILVVEDEHLIRFMVSEALREVGARVIEAANADEALVCLAADPKLRCVFTDVRMPGSMDGLQLLSRIASGFPHVKTVLTSGHLAPDQAPKDTLLIPKPYALEQVASLLIGLVHDNDGAPSADGAGPAAPT